MLSTLHHNHQSGIPVAILINLEDAQPIHRRPGTLNVQQLNIFTDAIDTVKDKAGDAKNGIGHAAGTLKHKVGGAANKVKDVAGNVTNKVKDVAVGGATNVGNGFNGAKSFITKNAMKAF